MINRQFKSSSLYRCSLRIVDNIIHKSFSTAFMRSTCLLLEITTLNKEETETVPSFKKTLSLL